MERNNQQRLMGSKEEIYRIVARGKRSKQRRPSKPNKAAATTTATTSIASSSLSACRDNGCAREEEHQGGSTESSPKSTRFTAEEYEVAEALLLLSLGPTTSKNNRASIRGLSPGKYSSHVQRTSRRKSTDKAGKIYPYHCKICNLGFESHQALGGHMNSHTKNADDHNITFILDRQGLKKNFHGRAIRESQFESHQGLGGDMGKHNPPVSSKVEAKSDVNGKKELKAKRVIDFDLNLPAAEDDL